MDIEKFVRDSLGEHKLLYLTQFGSHLYGTYSENSDIDYKGIFLPSEKSLLLQNKINNVTFSTGDDSSKNTKDDIDISLWSLQYYLKNLLAKGETEAIDVLFSLTNPSCILFNDGTLNEIYENRNNVFNPKTCKSFIHYAYAQAKKYGLKGHRVGVLKEIKNLIEKMNLTEVDFTLRLSKIAPEILDKCYHPSYCFSKEVNGGYALVICGKTHMYSITIYEFMNRISREWYRYGERARLAEQNMGLDFKALSHAYRAIVQMEELLTNWKIQYPLKKVQLIKDIKEGKLTWQEIEPIILDGLTKIECLQSNSNAIGSYSNSFVEKLILSNYNSSFK